MAKMVNFILCTSLLHTHTKNKNEKTLKFEKRKLFVVSSLNKIQRFTLPCFNFCYYNLCKLQILKEIILG